MPESSSLTQNWENVDKRETKKNPAANFSRGIFLVMSYKCELFVDEGLISARESTSK